MARSIHGQEHGRLSAGSTPESACSASQIRAASARLAARFTTKRGSRNASQRNRAAPRAAAAAGAPQQYSMGHGSSLPSEYKQKIQAAFQIKNTEAWRNAEDFDDELEMRNELMNLRALAAELVKDDRRKSTVYVQPTEKSLAVKKMLHAAMATNPLFKRCRTPEKEEMLGAVWKSKFHGAFDATPAR